MKISYDIVVADVPPELSAEMLAARREEILDQLGRQLDRYHAEILTNGGVEQPPPLAPPPADGEAPADPPAVTLTMEIL
jgi:hypothetical protein